MNQRQETTASINQITEGVIWKQLLLFFFPILFGTFFQQLYNTTDAVVVGNFVGTEALAAVGGPASTIINLLVGFFVGLSSGAGVVISQYFGSNSHDKLRFAVHTAMALSVIGGAGMIMAIAGAAVLTQIQGIVSDHAGGIEIAYWVPAIAFAIICYYGIFVCREEDHYGEKKVIEEFDKMSFCDMVCSLEEATLKVVLSNVKAEIDKLIELYRR